MTDRRSGEKRLMDVHGAGSQRSDPKAGDATKFPYGRGPQGDVIRIENHVRCVRGGKVETLKSGPKIEARNQARSIPPSSPADDIRERRGPGAASRPGQGPSGEMFIKRLDKDGNGSVSKAEFDGPAEHFAHLDKDGNGEISAEEINASRPPEQ